MKKSLLIMCMLPFLLPGIVVGVISIISQWGWTIGYEGLINISHSIFEEKIDEGI